jgi:hypothetical protein
MTGVALWLVLLGLFGLQAMLTERGNQAKVHRLKVWRIQHVLGGALLLASVIINALVATLHATALWNMRPVDVDEQPSPIWDCGVIHSFRQRGRDQIGSELIPVKDNLNAEHGRHD